MRPPTTMSLAEEFRAKNDAELAQLTGGMRPGSIFDGSLDQMMASMEIETRRAAREAPLKRKIKMQAHEELSLKMKENAFHPPTIEAVSALFSRATHLKFSDRGPYKFQYLPDWSAADDRSRVLRYDVPGLKSLIQGYPGDMFDGINCVMRHQIMNGMMKGNAVIIRGQHYDEEELFVDELQFLVQQITYLAVAP